MKLLADGADRTPDPEIHFCCDKYDCRPDPEIFLEIFLKNDRNAIALNCGVFFQLTSGHLVLDYSVLG